MSRAQLAQRQAALVAALVLGESIPEGFDPSRVRATADALLRKRAGEVAAQWPALRTQFGPQWSLAFAAWARGRAPQGSLRDGWDFARTVALHPDSDLQPASAVQSASGLQPASAVQSASGLQPAAAVELTIREARFVYDGTRPPRPRRLPAIRRTCGTLVIQLAGRIFTR
jgi:hypothetical protein